MNGAELDIICQEASKVFEGLRVGKVFPLGGLSLAIDFYPHSGSYLFIDCGPQVRQTYLITRRLRDLERASTHTSPFVISMRRLVTGLEVRSVSLVADARTMVLVLATEPDREAVEFVVQLGGTRPNMFILDRDHQIMVSARESTETGQAPGERYSPPAESADPGTIRELNGRSLSEVLDQAAGKGDADDAFASLVAAARKKVNTDIKKRQKLIKNLEGDLADQGDAAEWKRYGDLILSNIHQIRRQGDGLLVTDHYDPEQREISITVDKNLSPTEAAELFFKRYTKARNGAAVIAARMEQVKAELKNLENQREQIADAVTNNDAGYLETLVQPKPLSAPPLIKKKDKGSTEFKGVRRFVSSDGMEILVGKKAKDNDHLTFRIARSMDMWLHAADYPGSHVVVRNPNRKDIPDRTLTEAAQLAAFYSDARTQLKAAVRYTSKKFVHKPRRSAPGLVSLASFKTILVEPQVALPNADNN